MDKFVAISVIIVLGFIAAAHVRWALRGTSSLRGVVPEIGGQPTFVPSTTATFAVAAALSLAALIVASTAGLVALPIPTPILAWTSFAIAAVFVVRAIGDFRLVGLKRVKGSTFARLDTQYFRRYA